ncbi:holin [Acinetobacter gerneri]|uniref:holin n=1 Tax=Acinetobacter gerneri TaxID=202952 RepID=UPI0032132EE0
MQDHEKTFLTVILIGGLIGMGKLLVSTEKLTFRLVIGRTILGSATSLIAGLVLLQIPDISPIALLGIASALGILGSTFIEEYLKKRVSKWGK